MAKTEAAAVAVTADDRPDGLLPIGAEPPAIETDADADRALLELAFMTAHRKTVEAAISQRTEALVAELESRLQVDGRAYEDRAKELEAALLAFVKAKHPKLNSADGAKSLKLNHGTLKWVKQRDRIAYAGKKEHKDAVAAIDEATASIRKNSGGLTARLAELLGGIVLFGRGAKARLANLFLRVEVKVNLTDALKAYKAKQVTKQQLAKFHLEFVSGKPEFEAKPAKFEGRSTS